MNRRDRARHFTAAAERPRLPIGTIASAVAVVVVAKILAQSYGGRWDLTTNQARRYDRGAGAGGGASRTYDVSLDGSRFLMIKQGGGPEGAGATPGFVVVFNWVEESKRLVPTP